MCIYVYVCVCVCVCRLHGLMVPRTSSTSTHCSAGVSTYMHRGNSISILVILKPNLDYNNIFPIVFALNGVPFGAQSIAPNVWLISLTMIFRTGLVVTNWIGCTLENIHWSKRQIYAIVMFCY